MPERTELAVEKIESMDVIQYAKRPVRRVSIIEPVTGSQTFSISPQEDVELAVREICVSQGVDYEVVGPTLVASIQEMRVTEEPQAPSHSVPTGPSLQGDRIRRKCEVLEAENRKHKEDLKTLQAMKTSPGNANGLLREEARLMEERMKNSESEKFINRLEQQHRIETSKMQNTIQVLNKKVMEMQGQRLVPEAPRDELIIGLQEQVESLKKRLKAARTLSAFEESIADSPRDISPPKVSLWKGA